MIKKLFKNCIFFAIFILGISTASLAELKLLDGYTPSIKNNNLGGGFDYLPDGDIIGVGYVQGGAAKLYRYDYNEDGVPSEPLEILTFEANEFPSIIEVSPDGTFALIGSTFFGGAGTDKIRKLDLSTNTLTLFTELAGNYDAVFINNKEVLISANRNGYMGDNEILLFDIKDPSNFSVILKVTAPSGAIALNTKGDLYYMKGTTQFPAPSGSYRLKKFTSDLLQLARKGLRVLSESDSVLDISFDPSTDLEVSLTEKGENEIFISSSSGSIIRFKEGTSIREVFAKHTEGETHGFGKLSLYKSDESFIPNYGYKSRLLAAYALNSYSEHKALEVVLNKGDKVHERLDSRVCVGANGYLDQVNILSVINNLKRDLNVKVDYFDLKGDLKGSVTKGIKGGLKRDFIINDMGLQKDTYGTVCVTSDSYPGSFRGGIAIYKPNHRLPGGYFGEGFDFALYYPFRNPKTSKTILPLNTFHIGTDVRDTVANWISISDAKKDGKKLKGTLKVFDVFGNKLLEKNVSILDGARVDYPGHSFLSPQNEDKIGMAEFTPKDSTSSYYITLTRYFYDCAGVNCNNFLSAFAVPDRPVTKLVLSGGVNTINNTISVVELNNPSDSSVKAKVNIFKEDGENVGNPLIKVPAMATRHVVVNKSGESGYLESELSGVSIVDTNKKEISALNMMYLLSSDGKLVKAVSAPLVGDSNYSQVSQFNTFIDHKNITEVSNVTSTVKVLHLSYVDVSGTLLHKITLNLGPKETKRIDLSNVLPKNTFGSVFLTSNAFTGITFRNYVKREGQYEMPFLGY